MYSVPLSDCMSAGEPRIMNRLVKGFIIFIKFRSRFAFIAKYSRLNSSRLLSVRKTFPSLANNNLSQNSRHDCDTEDPTERMTGHSARAAPSWLVIILLETFRFFQSIYANFAVLLAPAVIGLLNNSNLFITSRLDIPCRINTLTSRNLFRIRSFMAVKT